MPDQERIPMDQVDLSLSLIMEFTKLDTLKLQGKLREQNVIVLIDSGATHNFILEALVQQLWLSTTSTQEYGIVLGNGMSLLGNGVYEGLQIELQGITVCDDFLPISLTNVDIILGIQWLRTLDYFESNYQTLTMQFTLGDQVIILHRDPALVDTRVR